MINSIVIGLTGGIGMGKTTASKMLKRVGLPIFNADEHNHNILNGKAFNQIKKLFPECIVNGKIDRVILGNVATGRNRIKEIENITHPIIREEIVEFIKNAKERIVVLDIPLLFEYEFDIYCDYIITLECPDFIQERRVLARNNFNIPKFEYIKKKQMPKREKRALSDFVVYSSLGKKKMFKDLLGVLKCVK